MRAVLVSFREPFLSDLIDGWVRFELRRVRFAQPGDIVVAYNSTERVVAGAFFAGEVVSAPPAELWPRVEGECGLARAEFDDWFEGRDLAHAVEVTVPRRLDEPFALGFAAPRTFRYLDDSTPELRRVLDLALT